MFSHLSPPKHHKCVFRPSEQCLFFQVDQFEGSHVYVHFKNEHFPIYLLRNPKDVCWNSQNSARFSEMIDLRYHMPRFTQKINIFPSISWKTPEMYVYTLTTVLIFLRQSIWGVTCLSLLSKWTFSNLSPRKPHKCVLKSSQQHLFFQDNPFEASHA